MHEELTSTCTFDMLNNYVSIFYRSKPIATVVHSLVKALIVFF